MAVLALRPAVARQRSPIPVQAGTDSPLRDLLGPFERRFVEEGFRTLLAADGEIEPRLRQVLGDALRHPGSLVRAQLVYGLLRSYGIDAATARRAGVAIEYFHTASLIFDDLPSMDNATARRGHPCPHLVHGEAAAILGALAFITRGYDLLWEVLGPLLLAHRERAAKLVAACLGVRGILNGQAFDLHFAAAGRSAAAHGKVAQGKTVSLIRLTLLLPALVAGAAEDELERLDRLAEVWGLAYQIVDDFKDRLMSDGETGKSSGRDQALGRPNLLAVIGARGALAKLDALLAEGRELVACFRIEAERWALLDKLQGILEDERRTVAERISA